jgi:hypothetical protein
MFEPAEHRPELEEHGVPPQAVWRPRRRLLEALAQAVRPALTGQRGLAPGRPDGELAARSGGALQHLTVVC